MKKCIPLAILSILFLAASGCSNQGTQTKKDSATAVQNKQAATTIENHPPIMKATVAAPAAGSITRAEGGAIAEIYAKKDAIAGKSVTVRGKVMKFSPMIMGKNWVHLQDGSGDAAAGTHDLSVTTSATVKAGDIVLATGTVAINRDFGAGYFYAVMLEDAIFSADAQ